MSSRRVGLALCCLSIVLVSCGGGGGGSTTPTSPTGTTSPTSVPSPTGATTNVGGGWEFNGERWRPTGTSTPPDCPSPLNMPLPVDLTRVTSILYPGQVRGEFKPHGGFRFDLPGQTTAVNVTAPMAATIVRGLRHLVNGEIQYGFDFVNSCGIMYRFGHLRDLPPRFQALADAFPPALENVSRGADIPGNQTVTAGELIATGIGLRDSERNVFIDYGVYDLRQRNAVSADPAWLASHNNETAPYGTCWFDLLSAGDAARVRSLPPNDGVGRMSDYCR